MAAVAVVVGRYDLVENIDVGGTETMTAGRQTWAGAGEAGCTLLSSKLAGGYSKDTWVCRRLVEGTRRRLRQIWKEMWRNVGRG